MSRLYKTSPRDWDKVKSENIVREIKVLAETIDYLVKEKDIENIPRSKMKSLVSDLSNAHNILKNIW